MDFLPKYPSIIYGRPKCYVFECEQTDLQTDNQTGLKLNALDLLMWGV